MTSVPKDDPSTPTLNAEGIGCNAWLALAARWLEEARDRRSDMEEEKALGGRHDDAIVGYCEALEDKAGELRAIGRCAVDSRKSFGKESFVVDVSNSRV